MTPAHVDPRGLLNHSGVTCAAAAKSNKLPQRNMVVIVWKPDGSWFVNFCPGERRSRCGFEI